MAIKNSEKDEHLRQRNKDTFHNAALYWNKLANERLFEITKQLLGITLIILPLTGSIVLTDKILCKSEINLLVYGWLFLFASIISGFINLWIEAKYFNYLSNSNSSREEIWSDSNKLVERMTEETNKLDKTKPSSSFIPLIIQSITLLLGVFFIILVIYSLLAHNS